MTRRLKHWGWGFEDQWPGPDALRDAAALARTRLGYGADEPEQPVPLEQVTLPEPRLQPPEALKGICRTDPYERALHAYGRSYIDIVRAFRGHFDHPPDVVARPRDEHEVQAVQAAAGPLGPGQLGVPISAHERR